MFCRHCGKEIMKEDAAFCPACGKPLKAAAETEAAETGAAETETDMPDDSAASTRLSGKAILAIVIVVLAVVVVSGVVVFAYNRNPDTELLGSVGQAKLSEENVQKANEILEITDDFLGSKLIDMIDKSNRPKQVEDEIAGIRASIVVPAEDDASYDVTMQLIAYIQDIEREIENGTFGNLVSSALEKFGGDEDVTVGVELSVLSECRDALDSFVKAHS